MNVCMDVRMFPLSSHIASNPPNSFNFARKKKRRTDLEREREYTHFAVDRQTDCRAGGQTDRQTVRHSV